jgi:hypothetical protein
MCLTKIKKLEKEEMKKKSYGRKERTYPKQYNSEKSYKQYQDLNQILNKII